MLKNLIYYYLLESRKDRENKDMVRFTPHALPECDRQYYYQLFRTSMESNPPEAPSLLKMEFGSAIHFVVRKILKDIKRDKNLFENLKERYKYLKDFDYIEGEELRELQKWGLTFRYKVDNIIKINNDKYVIEIKSTFGRGFKRIENIPDQKHIAQLIFYMLFEGIDKGILLYAGRDTGYLLEYWIVLDKKNNQILISKNYFEMTVFCKNIYSYLKPFILKMRKLKKQIENNEIPKRDFLLNMKNINGKIVFDFIYNGEQMTTYPCANYCAWRDLCWKDEIEEIKKYKFFINGKFLK